MAKFLKKLTITERKQSEDINETGQENIKITESDQNLRSAATFSREQAKADLEKRIAEKLSRMSDTDLEELFNLHQQQLQAKKRGDLINATHL